MELAVLFYVRAPERLAVVKKRCVLEYIFLVTHYYLWYNGCKGCANGGHALVSALSEGATTVIACGGGRQKLKPLRGYGRFHKSS